MQPSGCKHINWSKIIHNWHLQDFLSLGNQDTFEIRLIKTGFTFHFIFKWTLRKPCRGTPKTVFFGLFENRDDIFLILQLNELYGNPIRGTPKTVFLWLLMVEGLLIEQFNYLRRLYRQFRDLNDIFRLLMLWYGSLYSVQCSTKQDWIMRNSDSSPSYIKSKNLLYLQFLVFYV